MRAKLHALTRGKICQMNPKIRVFYVIISIEVMITPLAWAWNDAGHEVVAAIAYAQLTPVARERIDRLTHVLFKEQGGYARFLHAAVWPDQLRYQDVTAFNHWHYINQPRPGPDNVVWALQQSMQILASPRVHAREQAFFLAFFVHLIGDVHQPLHCIGRDAGGTLTPVMSPLADNLHSYWDQGLGLFAPPVSRDAVQRWATAWIQNYPQGRLASEIKVQDPQRWAQAGLQLAQTVAFTLSAHSRPTAAYTELGQATAERQIVLAGYRCATLLNQIFTS